MAIGKFFKVDAAGSYLPVIDPIDRRTSATTLNLASLGLVPGDWMALEATGAFKAGGSFGDDVESMIAVFRSATGLLRPGPTTRFEPAMSLPAYPSGLGSGLITH